MKHGIFYIAIGEEYVQQAILSARSIRRFCDIPFALMTDREYHLDLSLFSSVRYVTKKSSTVLKTYDRVLNLKNSPFENTLFLDTDTYILEDISPVFALLDKFEMVFTFAHARELMYSIYHRDGKIAPGIPRIFPVLQGGFLLYRKSDRVNDCLTDFISIYEMKQYFYDQVALREAVWKSEIDFCILPEEYNFNSIEFVERWKAQNYSVARPKIFHYTGNKKDIHDLLERHQI